MPTPTSKRLLEAIPTFSQTQAKFSEDEFTIHKCIATPYGNDCRNLLTAQRQSIAASLIAKDAATLDLDDIRSIITLLHCESCQKKYNHRHKRKVADKWQYEFTDLDLRDINWPKDSHTPSRNGTPVTTPRSTSSNTVSVAGSARSTLNVDEPNPFEASPTPASRTTPRDRPPSAGHSARRHSFRPGHMGEQNSFVQEHIGGEGVDPYAVSQALTGIVRSDRSSAITNNVIDLTADEDESMPDTPIVPDVSASSYSPMRDAPTVSDVSASSFSPMPDAPTVPDVSASSFSPMPDAPTVPDVAAGSFFPGDASRWTPEMVVNDVENLLRSEMPAANRGAIYAFKQVDGPHVKIGFTTQAGPARRAQIKNKSKIVLDKDEYYCTPLIELRRMLRLEKLVHADLAYAQRDLRIAGKANTRTTQHEWFEVDFETAKQSINFWYDVVNHQDKVVELDDTADRSFLAIRNGNTSCSINADHARRLKYWKQRVIIPQKHTAESVLRWIMGCGVIGLVPIFLNVPDRFVYPFLVLGLAVWTRIFTGRVWVI